MSVPNKSASDKAFTRLELVVVLAVLCLLAAVTWPALAVTAARSERATCVNNLRQIGRAYQIWGSDHDGQRPWDVGESSGGQHPPPPLSPPGLALWYQFYFVSGDLGTPRILACPSDNLLPQRHVADNWTMGPNGLLNLSNRNNSLSYFLSFDAPPLLPQMALGGDRTVNYVGPQRECSTVGGLAWPMTTGVSAPMWTNALHGVTGNLVLNDGSVLQTSTAGLRTAAANADYNNGVNHTLSP